MKLIKAIHVEGFRSIREAKLSDLGHFSVLAGVNNAGKSNFLKTLSLFFTDKIEDGKDFNITRDYFRHDKVKGRRQRVRISCDFVLPNNFRFRSDLSHVKDLLGNNFTITKAWDRFSLIPDIYLNNRERYLGADDSNRVNTFLNLFNFRYIPNRVIPTDIIREEQEGIRNVLVRRLSQNRQQYEHFFEDIGAATSEISRNISALVAKMIPDISQVNLTTAQSFEDLVMSFVYQIQEGTVQVDQEDQGSGLQSLLMLQTLHLVDTDFSKSFGWKQAAVWAVEEPESSLHTKLEAEVANFIRSVCDGSENRLQIIATTHSDVMIQYSDSGFFIERRPYPVSQSPASTVPERLETTALLEKAAQFGVSRWINPNLRFPLEPLVLVEGKTDKEFLFECIRLLRLKPRYRIECLADLLGEDREGGIERLLKFIRDNIKLIKNRSVAAPVVVVIDWDARGKGEGLRNAFRDINTLKVIIWGERQTNPQLHDSFTGIERFFSDRIIEEVEEILPDKIGTTRSGLKQVTHKNYDSVKKELAKIIQDGLQESDIEFAKKFVQELHSLATRLEARDLFY